MKANLLPATHRCLTVHSMAFLDNSLKPFLASTKSVACGVEMPCGAGEELLLCLTFLPVAVGWSSGLDLLAGASSTSTVAVLEGSDLEVSELGSDDVEQSKNINFKIKI